MDMVWHYYIANDMMIFGFQIIKPSINNFIRVSSFDKGKPFIACKSYKVKSFFIGNFSSYWHVINIRIMLAFTLPRADSYRLRYTQSLAGRLWAGKNCVNIFQDETESSFNSEETRLRRKLIITG